MVFSFPLRLPLTLVGVVDRFDIRFQCLKTWGEGIFLAPFAPFTSSSVADFEHNIQSSFRPLVVKYSE